MFRIIYTDGCYVTIILHHPIICPETICDTLTLRISVEPKDYYFSFFYNAGLLTQIKFFFKKMIKS